MSLAALARRWGTPLYVYSADEIRARIIEEELRLSRFLEWSFVSCESGLRKPDPAAYTQALTSLGLAADPSRVVFVDDSRTNCEAAAALGIDAVQFTDVASLRAALVERGFTELIV